MPVPLRKYAHEERVSLAQSISEQILSKHGDSTLAVFICGSTSKKLEGLYSSLEMIAVVHDGTNIPTKYYLYNGLAVEIEYAQESNFLQAARRITLNWPIEADQYHNRIALFDRDEWLRKLDRTVSETDESEMVEALRAAAVEMVEDLSVLRNAELLIDTIGIRARGLYLTGDICKVVLIMNRRYVLPTSWFWKQAFECPIKPANFQQLIEKMAGFAPNSSRAIVQAAEELCEALVNMVRERGITIESEELLV